MNDYYSAMKRLRFCIRMLTPVLLALIARSVIAGPTLALVVTGALIALLLLASGQLWRRGRQLDPSRHPPVDQEVNLRT